MRWGVEGSRFYSSLILEMPSMDILWKLEHKLRSAIRTFSLSITKCLLGVLPSV